MRDRFFKPFTLESEVYNAALECEEDSLAALATARSIMAYGDQERIRDGLDWGISTLALEMWLGLSELFEMNSEIVTGHLNRFRIEFSDQAVALLLSDVELFDEIIYKTLSWDMADESEMHNILVAIAYEIDSANQEQYYCIYCGHRAGVNFVCDDCQDEISEELAMLHTVYRKYTI